MKRPIMILAAFSLAVHAWANGGIFNAGSWTGGDIYSAGEDGAISIEKELVRFAPNPEPGRSAYDMDVSVDYLFNNDSAARRVPCAFPTDIGPLRVTGDESGKPVLSAEGNDDGIRLAGLLELLGAEDWAGFARALAKPVKVRFADAGGMPWLVEGVGFGVAIDGRAATVSEALLELRGDTLRVHYLYALDFPAGRSAVAVRYRAVPSYAEDETTRSLEFSYVLGTGRNWKGPISKIAVYLDCGSYTLTDLRLPAGLKAAPPPKHAGTFACAAYVYEPGPDDRIRIGLSKYEDEGGPPSIRVVGERFPGWADVLVDAFDYLGLGRDSLAWCPAKAPYSGYSMDIEVLRPIRGIRLVTGLYKRSFATCYPDFSDHDFDPAGHAREARDRFIREYVGRGFARATVCSKGVAIASYAPESPGGDYSELIPVALLPGAYRIVFEQSDAVDELPDPLGMSFDYVDPSGEGDGSGSYGIDGDVAKYLALLRESLGPCVGALGSYDYDVPPAVLADAFFGPLVAPQAPSYPAVPGLSMRPLPAPLALEAAAAGSLNVRDAPAPTGRRTGLVAKGAAILAVEESSVICEVDGILGRWYRIAAADGKPGGYVFGGWCRERR